MAKSKGTEVFMGRVVKRHSPAVISGDMASGMSMDDGGMGGSGTTTAAGAGGGSSDPISSMLDFGKGSREAGAKVKATSQQAEAEAAREIGF